MKVTAKQKSKTPIRDCWDVSSKLFDSSAKEAGPQAARKCLVNAAWARAPVLPK